MTAPTALDDLPEAKEEAPAPLPIASIPPGQVTWNVVVNYDATPGVKSLTERFADRMRAAGVMPSVGERMQRWLVDQQTTIRPDLRIKKVTCAGTADYGTRIGSYSMAIDIEAIPGTVSPELGADYARSAIL